MNANAIAGEVWTPTTYDHVVLAFLRAEWEKFPAELKARMGSLVTSPSLSVSNENSLRMCLLNKLREPLLQRIPDDTNWFEVKYLRRPQLHELRVINHSDWNSTSDSNELPRVAVRRPESLTSDASTWPNPILWGHTKGGPFTILEGNHRLTASGRGCPVDFKIPVYLGLTSKKCCWHLPDRA